MKKKDLNPNYSIKVQNMVGSIVLNKKIDLEEVSFKIPSEYVVKYIPEKFPGLNIKLKELNVSCSIFSSGKMIITGAKSEFELEKSTKTVIDLLNNIGIEIINDPLIQIENIVASGSIGIKIDLELSSLLLDNSLYEPEQFPGLIYRMQHPNPKLVLLLFQSGKLVCTGARTLDAINKSIEIIFNMLDEIDALQK